MQVPFLDLKIQYKSIKQEVDSAIQKVIDSKYEDVAKIDKQVRKSIVSNIYKTPQRRYLVASNPNYIVFATFRKLVNNVLVIIMFQVLGTLF